jgi:uncharacterized CHY-type Zn-finger protein
MRLRGRPVDAQSRCVHWSGPTDVVAFRFACCDGWWPCHACHEASAGHPAKPWPRSRFAEPSVLCGACQSPLTVPQYLAGGDACLLCGAPFNPRCRPHHPLYFEAASGQ